MKYQICTKCIMDTSDHHISFDHNGVCNHCIEYETVTKPQIEQNKARFNNVIQEIKDAGYGRKYDTILGLSGGIDSSYLAYLAMTYGLTPLLFHVDNGWDAEFAKRNIKKIIDKTGFDYYHYILNWKEFKDLQLSYLKASVIDIEVPTDHAIAAAVFELADRLDIKYISSGTNYATEACMPKGWSFLKLTLANLLGIHKKFGTVELKTFPTLGINKAAYYTKKKLIRDVIPLCACDYNIKRAKQQMKTTFDWEDYAGKHYESTFTKFYQSYILPKKFGIDKRRAHYSNLIYSDNMTRDEALEKINKPPYTPEELDHDYNYVINKLGLTPDKFEEIMALPIVSHYTFPGDIPTAETKALLGMK